MSDNVHRHVFNAHSKSERRAYMERLLEAWNQVPHLRLGQLLVNAGIMSDPFYVDDLGFVEVIESYVVKGKE